ncbi:MAG: nucleoside triphosphate pyrophosphohydrolase [Acidobacteriota bacterium]
MKEEFEKLVNIIEKLRSPEGCPWDREQDEFSLIEFIFEECWEIIDSIKVNDKKSLKEELGDLLLQVVFLSQIAKEKGEFDIKDVIRSANRKTIERHPHVFGTKKLKTSGEVLEHWEEFKKRKERKSSIVNGIPENFPALLQAFTLGVKASRVGFNWKKPEEALDKVKEELIELKKAILTGKKEKLEEEIGDLLFSISNVSRLMRINPEIALKIVNKKFIKRFKFIEEEAKKRKKKLNEYTLQEMDMLWEKSKKN